MDYNGDLGCRYGMPHDLKVLFENKKLKVEICQLCGQKMRWNKTNTGRVDNNEYLKAHVRNFAQRGGATKRVYHKIYKPEKCIIKI